MCRRHSWHPHTQRDKREKRILLHSGQVAGAASNNEPKRKDPLLEYYISYYYTSEGNIWRKPTWEMFHSTTFTAEEHFLCRSCARITKEKILNTNKRCEITSAFSNSKIMLIFSLLKLTICCHFCGGVRPPRRAELLSVPVVV